MGSNRRLADRLISFYRHTNAMSRFLAACVNVLNEALAIIGQRPQRPQRLLSRLGSAFSCSAEPHDRLMRYSGSSELRYVLLCG